MEDRLDPKVLENDFDMPKPSLDVKGILVLGLDRESLGLKGLGGTASSHPRDNRPRTLGIKLDCWTPGFPI